MDKKIEELKNILEEIFKYLEIDPKFTIDDTDGDLLVEIWDGDLSFLIGYRGRCLKALKNYLSLALNRNLEEDEWVRVTVDIEGYLARRREKVEEIARNYIDKVRFFGHEVSLPNMDSSERYIVHTYVNEYPDIDSESEGKGFNRHVVLKPLNQEEQNQE